MDRSREYVTNPEDHVCTGQRRAEVTCRHRGHMFVVIKDRKGTRHNWSPENKERELCYAVSYEAPRFCLIGENSKQAIEKAKQAIDLYRKLK